MLKLYKATVLISAGIGVFALGVGVLCEWCQIPHGTFLQNLAIGLFCSLLVVVITSALQYKYAQKDIVRGYTRSLWNLVSQTGMAYRVANYNFADEFYNDLFEKINTAFERFDLYSDELAWFDPKKQKYTRMINLYEKRMQISCFREALKSDKEAVLSFSRNADYIAIIDSAIILFRGSKIGEILQCEKDFSLKVD